MSNERFNDNLTPKAMFDWVGIGEVMLGTHHTPLESQIAVSGDVFNTLAVMAKKGHSVALYTVLGHDAATPKILEAIRDSGVLDHLVLTHPNKPNGYYETREEVLTYQRNESACRELVREFGLDTRALLDLSNGIFLSGVTLAVCKDGLDYFEQLFRAAQARGVMTALDPNYRPSLWASPEAAWSAIERLLPYTDIFLPSLEDMTGLLGVRTEEGALDALTPYDLPMTVMTLGENGARIDSKNLSWSALPSQAYPNEWMLGAGDAFNGGFLSAWTSGDSMREALEAGNAAVKEAFYLKLMNQGPDPLDNPNQFFETNELSHAV